MVRSGVVLVAVVAMLMNVAVRGIPAAPAPKSSHWGVNLTTIEMIEEFGYPAENHTVTTEDGYILELHRIPYGKSGPSPDRPPVFLQHGILCSSADFVMNTADQALGYLLADAGYDVWIGNFRGNTYSHSHIELSTEQLSYWNFNWDEHAYYDLPACIDYVLETTGNEDLYYVGFSMGSTTFFAMMSEKPEYNNKIRVAAMMGPSAFAGHMKGPIIELAPYTNELDTLMTMLGIGEFLPSGEVMDYLAVNYCDDDVPTVAICYNIIFLLCGPDSEELNIEYLPALLSHTPAGTSVHTVAHYGQMVLSDEFIKYDYGLIGNLNHYGQETPPLYSLANVTIPVGLFHSDNDWLADPVDVARLEAELPNVVLSHRVEYAKFNHLDFVWAIHARELVYSYLMEFLSRY